jgi:hypothetical protein
MPMREVKIYCLICPITKEPKYIGQTIGSLKSRLASHTSGQDNGNKKSWIKSLAADYLRPEIILLQTCQESDANKIEKEWIEIFKNRGSQLLNSKFYMPCVRPCQKGKVSISTETYRKWVALKKPGDLFYLGFKMKVSQSRAKNIIDSRKGTPEQIEIISKFYNARWEGAEQ